MLVGDCLTLKENTLLVLSSHLPPLQLDPRVVFLTSSHFFKHKQVSFQMFKWYKFVSYDIQFDEEYKNRTNRPIYLWKRQASTLFLNVNTKFCWLLKTFTLLPLHLSSPNIATGASPLCLEGSIAEAVTSWGL